MKKRILMLGLCTLLIGTSCFSDMIVKDATYARGIEGAGVCYNNSPKLRESMEEKFGIYTSRHMPVTFKNGFYVKNKTYYLSENINDDKLLTFCNNMELEEPIILDDLTSKEFIKYLYNLQEFSEIHNKNRKLMLKNGMSVGNPFAIKTDIDLEMLKSLNNSMEESIKKIKALSTN